MGAAALKTVQSPGAQPCAARACGWRMETKREQKMQRPWKFGEWMSAAGFRCKRQARVTGGFPLNVGRRRVVETAATSLLCIDLTATDSALTSDFGVRSLFPSDLRRAALHDPGAPLSTRETRRY